MTSKPSCLFAIAVKNIARATLREFDFPSVEMDPDATPLATLELELRKPGPHEDFDLCRVALISKSGSIEQRIVCDASLIADRSTDPRKAHLLLLPIRLEERAAAVARAKTSNEEAFEVLAIQAGMYGGDAGVLIDELEFVEEDRPETATRILHAARSTMPDPADTGEYPELTIVQADYCPRDEEPAPEEPALQRRLIEDILDGLGVDFFRSPVRNAAG